MLGGAYLGTERFTNIRMTPHSISIWLESYDRFAAKLLNLCRARFPASARFNPAVVFSGHDLAQGRAVLWLTKHFGRFPCEIGEFDGMTDLSEVELFIQQAGIPVLVQAVPVLGNGSDTIPGFDPVGSHGNDEAVLPGNVQVHLPAAGWLKDSPQQASADYLFRQVAEISGYLLEKNKPRGGGFVYVAGFNLSPSTSDGESMPAASFLPWYCFLCDDSDARRIYRQPELGRLFAGLTSNNPDAVDLEELIAKMEEEEPQD